MLRPIANRYARGVPFKLAPLIRSISTTTASSPTSSVILEALAAPISSSADSRGVIQYRPVAFSLGWSIPVELLYPACLLCGLLSPQGHSNLGPHC